MKHLNKLGLWREPTRVAVDLGSWAIKVVQVRWTKGEPELAGAGSSPVPVGATQNLSRTNHELVAALSLARERAGLGQGQAIVSLPARSTIIRQLKLPAMPQKDLKQAVKWEMEKKLPVTADNLIFEHVKLCESVENGDKFVHILLAAAPEELVYSCRDLLLEAGFMIRGIDIQPFALWRVFGLNGKGQAQECRVVLDVGATSSQILILQGGEIKLARILPLGGSQLQVGDNWDQQELLSRSGLGDIIRETRNSLEEFRAIFNLPVGKLLVTGGTARVRGICPYLGEQLGLPAELGLPGAALARGQAAAEMNDPSYSVALGLALRQMLN